MAAEQNQLTAVLEDLRRLTGLSLLVPDEVEDPEEAAEKLRLLADAYREKYDKTNFLRNLLYGAIPEADLYVAASRFHIPGTGRRILFLLECQPGDSREAARIMKHLFLSSGGDQFAVLDEQHMVLIRDLGGERCAESRKKGRRSSGASAEEAEEKYRTLAHTIVDMLNTEAMIRVRLGYSRPVDNLRELPDSFREAMLSLRIGKIFMANEVILSYEHLGVGRLIHDLPEETCRHFLKEVFRDGSPDDFDEETVTIINAFFENNLNISETARQLYVHRNTLVYRLEKLHQATGLDLRVFDDALELKIAMMISDSLKYRE